MTETINSNLENQEGLDEEKKDLNQLQTEVKKTIEEQENAAKLLIWKDLIEGPYAKEYNMWINVIYIQTWVFAVKGKWRKNISFYANEKWETIFGIWWVEDRPFIENWKAIESAWYVRKIENEYENFYKIIWHNQNNKPVLGDVINIESKEYYQVWLDILFYADIYNKLWRIEHSMEKNTKTSIRLFIEHGSFKFEDLEIFKNKEMITDEIFEYGKEELQKKLLEQIADKRLDNLWAGESSDDEHVRIFCGIFLRNLDDYLEKWYINHDLYKKWFIKLAEVGKINTNDVESYLKKWKIDSDTAKKCYDYLK